MTIQASLGRIGFTERGAWVDTVTDYELNDLVQHRNGIWRCAIKGTRTEPSTLSQDWILWVQGLSNTNASGISFNSATTHLTATNVQMAVEQLTSPASTTIRGLGRTATPQEITDRAFLGDVPAYVTAADLPPIPTNRATDTIFGDVRIATQEEVNNRRTVGSTPAVVTPDLLPETGGGGVPVGTISWILADTPPVGHISLSNDNGFLNRVAYNQLWEEAQRSGKIITEAEWQTEFTANGTVGYYSSGNDTTTFRVPLIRKVFLRAPTGSDGSNVGEYQVDTMRPATGVTLTVGGNSSTVTGAFKHISYAGSTNLGSGPGETRQNIGLDTSLLGPHFSGTETAPVNITLLPIMKTHDVVTNVANVDLEDALLQINSRLETTRFEEKLPLLPDAWGFIDMIKDGGPAAIISGVGITGVTRVSTGATEVYSPAITPTSGIDVSTSYSNNPTRQAVISFEIKDNRVAGKASVQSQTLAPANTNSYFFIAIYNQ